MATGPVLTSSLMPRGLTRVRNALTFSSLPVISTVYVLGETSITRPPEYLHHPEDLFPGLFVCIDLDQHHLPGHVLHIPKINDLYHVYQLVELLQDLFEDASLPVVTIVIAETVGSRVSATHRLSMLKPLPLKSPATRARTPNSFSTRTDMVCLTYPPSHEHHLVERCACRYHRIDAFLGVDMHVDERRSSVGEGLLEDLVHFLFVALSRIPRLHKPRPVSRNRAYIGARSRSIVFS